MKNDNHKAEFSERLNYAMTENKIKPRSRVTELVKITDVTSKEAARKWLTGMSVPGKGNLRAIAKRLGCREEWLEYGVEPIWVSRDASEVDSFLTEVRELLEGLDEAKSQRLMQALRLLIE